MSGQHTETALGEFFSEAEEQLQRMGQILGDLESNRAQPKAIDSFYRDIHTLKGTAQLFGFKKIGQISHAIEASMEPIRSKRGNLSQPLIQAIYFALDLLEFVIKSKPTNEGQSEKLSQEFEETLGKVIDAATSNFGASYNIPKTPLGIKENLTKEREFILTHANSSSIQESSHEGTAQASQMTQTNSPMVQPSQPVIPASAQASPNIKDEASSTVRVQVSLLDRMMNLISEMVLVRNQVLQFSKKSEDHNFLSLSQKLDLVTTELQEEVMRTRMQPIGNVLSKFQRMARDLAKDLGKEIELEIEGADTELDKTLLEAVRDPLTHIIRNSCDHGIESIEERKKLKKKPVGTVTIRAFQEGGHIIIQIQDDGRGLDCARIASKAIEKNIITADQAQKMSQREIGMLIFAPGFSTAAQVSNVSGRGVGMDVVLTNIQRVGGQVDLQSKLGDGLTVTLTIPLTLAIVPAMMIRTLNEVFAIPQIKLQELLRIQLDAQSNSLEILEGSPVFRLRGKLLPLVSLRTLYGQIEQAKSELLNQSITVMVLNSEGTSFGLIVDDVLDTADIVVKPLTQILKSMNIYSGATIMGDGRVALILDVGGLAKKAGIAQTHENNSTRVSHENANVKIEAQEYLFFSLENKGDYCAPLCLVNRLEEIDSKSVEITGKQRVVRYRNSILPLVSVDSFIFNTSPQNHSAQQGPVLASDRLSIIVVQKKNRLFGLEVKSIEDIRTIEANLSESIQETAGILGSLVVGNEVASVVDLLGIIDQITGDYSESKGKQVNRKRKGKRILFAEDTPFFKKQVIKLLEAEGFQVVHADDGAIALTILDQNEGEPFDLILSDIEMPNKTGFELAVDVRKNSKWAKLPLIAITTRFREVDQQKGKEVGFTEYLEKLKGDQLLEAIDRCLGIGVGA